MKSSHSQIAQTLGRVADLLVAENFIEDDEVLDSALSAVLQKFVKDQSPEKPSQPSSRLTHIKQMLENAKKNKEKLEVLRKKLNQDQIDELKPQPTINENSKKLCKGFTKDVVERAQMDLKKRAEWLKRNQDAQKCREKEELRQNCSFSPFSRGKSSRKPEEVVKGLYEWKERVDEKICKKKEVREKEEMKEVYGIPRIRRVNGSGSQNKTEIMSRVEHGSFTSDQLFAQLPNSFCSKSANSLPVQKEVIIDTSKYSYEEIVKMLSCNSSFAFNY